MNKKCPFNLSLTMGLLMGCGGYMGQIAANTVEPVISISGI
ncbi:MAG: hypothetical protein VSS75_005865 [Candidatus Parabeggiatoa sp.]|nr:hypothetical protein [Candidatus Parabeggiatoa sp.]